jgi:hypothetical protein
MLQTMNTTNDNHLSPVVLLVEPDERDRELYGAWLEDAGMTPINCPGPQMPELNCLGTGGRPCPLLEVADLAVLYSRQRPEQIRVLSPNPERQSLLLSVKSMLKEARTW